ncbi:sortilin [Lingula anatina]|uniref:Sortilin n=1 Tax=Lingula anatina TaxID=7574 RepID=A0A1S3IST3_LINAN|nr:sortilin [Lingula anatina]|eukprot:XP_013401133.1 sortilin [Lingula anatina]
MAFKEGGLVLLLLCDIICIQKCCSLDIHMEKTQKMKDSSVQNYLRSTDELTRVKRDYDLNLPGRNQRFRRDAEDTTCEQQKNQLDFTTPDFVNTHQFVNETKASMALAWAGDNSGVILVAVTEEMGNLARPSVLYRSTNFGRSFEDINSRINNVIMRKDNGLQKNPNDANNIFIVAHNLTGDVSDLYITQDGGSTFSHFTMPFILRDEMLFHPSNNNLILAQKIGYSSKDLYLSQDGGRTWRLIHTDIVKYKWDPNGAPGFENAIYATYDKPSILTSIFGGIISKSYDYQLLRSTDLGANWKMVNEHIYEFGVQGKFLFTSVNQQGSYQRALEVSTDGGESWNGVQVPTVTEDRFYSILDMSEGMIFLHVDKPGDTGHGTLYISDSSGIVFTESLEKHLYPNYLDLTDFYKVESMRGVYIASQMSDDNSIHSMISFDRGAEWKPIKAPPGVPCHKACYLQIHNHYSIARNIPAKPPLSSKSAVGIILAHGHVADALQNTPPDVFVSDDGGYNWIKALDGPHHYQIADQGGLLVAIPYNTSTPNIVKFSTDGGRCWHEHKFTDEVIVFTGLLTEPGNKAMTVSIWGYGQVHREWRVFVIDFQKIIKRQCQDPQDYEEWSPHGELHGQQDEWKGCLIGYKETYKRVIKDSLCYNGRSYSVERSGSETPCTCRREDYECDFGFVKNAKEECVRDSKFSAKELKICINNHVTEDNTIGYRKIPGDGCHNGFVPQQSTEITLDVICNEESKNLVKIDENGHASMVNTDYDYVDHEIMTEVKNGKGGGTNGGIVAVILVCIVVLVLGMGFFFFRKLGYLGNKNVSYRYSSLSQSDEFDYDNDVENIIGSHKTIYQDNSDDEEAMLKDPKNPKVKSYHDDSDVDILD